MKSHYEISIVSNDLFKNESLLQVINNLEKLEQITEDVFTRINKNILEKKTKLENLKSRINRASSIISSFETVPQALTIKSKRFYPILNSNNANNNNNDANDTFNFSQSNNNNSYSNNPYYKSIYYDDVCDFNLLKNNSVAPQPYAEINSKPNNPPSKLGKKPDGSLEDVTLCQEILNSQKPFKEVKSDLTIRNCATNLFNKGEIANEINLTNSIFQFMDKTKVFGEKQCLTPSEPRGSNLLNNFMNKRPQHKTVKKPQEAPVSITDKVKMTQFKQKKDLIRRNTNNNSIQLNIPLNLNLPLISDFITETAPSLEDYFAEDKPAEIYAPQGIIYNDDVNEYQMPLDIIKNYNTKHQQGGSGSNNVNVTANNNMNNNSQQINNTQNVAINNTVQNTNTNLTNNTNNIPSVPQQPTQNIQQQQQINKPPQNVQNVIPPTNIPQPPTNIPKPPTSSSIPPVPKIPGVPKLPPMIPPIPKPINPPQGNSQQPQAPKRHMTIIEELGDNPMARLKKIDVTKVSAPKKTLPNPTNVMDLLKQQIDLRFNNLNKNAKPVKSKKKKKKNDSDSFSSSGQSD